MQVFNYGAYARAFELGVTKPNMTKIAKALFEPIISLDGVVNRVGNPYTIDSKLAKAWYNQTDDIPGNIKDAAARTDLFDSIGDYFSNSIIDVLTNQMQESQMYSAMIVLIKSSNLQETDKEMLLEIYQDGDKADFLGKAFLYAVMGDNTVAVPVAAVEPVDEDIKKLKELIKRKYPKPKGLNPPEEIEDHELGYVRELYRVYHEKSGEEFVRPEDLDGHPALRRNFDRQRKDYYKAETIHRELRDTIRMDEAEGFDLLKDEMYDGIITTRDKDYDDSYDRLNAVMEHATEVPLSNNLQDRMLDWVGPGEKKGVCHMLVNDERIKWTEDDDDEE